MTHLEDMDSDPLTGRPLDWQPVLKAAEMDLTNVVSVTAYLADIADYDRFNAIYREYFTVVPLPTRSTVAVSALARDARVELTMTAVRTGR